MRNFTEVWSLPSRSPLEDRLLADMMAATEPTRLKLIEASAVYAQVKRDEPERLPVAVRDLQLMALAAANDLAQWRSLIDFPAVLRTMDLDPVLTPPMADVFDGAAEYNRDGDCTALLQSADRFGQIALAQIGL